MPAHSNATTAVHDKDLLQLCAQYDSLILTSWLMMDGFVEEPEKLLNLPSSLVWDLYKGDLTFGGRDASETAIYLASGGLHEAPTLSSDNAREYTQLTYETPHEKQPYRHVTHNDFRSMNHPVANMKLVHQQHFDNMWDVSLYYWHAVWVTLTPVLSMVGARSKELQRKHEDAFISWSMEASPWRRQPPVKKLRNIQAQLLKQMG